MAVNKCSVRSRNNRISRYDKVARGAYASTENLYFASMSKCIECIHEWKNTKNIKFHSMSVCTYKIPSIKTNYEIEA